MLASFILASALSMSASSGAPAMFGCSWVESEQDDPFFLDTVELRAERTRGENGETWDLQWADNRTAHARAYPIAAGRFGEKVRLEWSESGEVTQAFVSNLPFAEVGREMVFISVDSAAQDGPPGYVCTTAPLEENRS
jgi:hypothetical protein